MPISIVIPTLNRAEQLRNVLLQLVATTKGACETIVIVDAEDYDSVKVCADIATAPNVFTLRCISMEGSPTAVEKWNEGAKKSSYKHLDETWLMLAADDIIFPRGWLEDAIASENKGFLAFRDTEGSKKFFEPHYMATVKWLKDYNGGVLAIPLYTHWGLDVETAARARNSNTYCVATPIIKHNHWIFNTAPQDSTYVRGSRSHARDIELFNSRRIDKFPNNFRGYL